MGLTGQSQCLKQRCAQLASTSSQDPPIPTHPALRYAYCIVDNFWICNESDCFGIDYFHTLSATLRKLPPRIPETSAVENPRERASSVMRGIILGFKNKYSFCKLWYYYK